MINYEIEKANNDGQRNRLISYAESFRKGETKGDHAEEQEVKEEEKQ